MKNVLFSVLAIVAIATSPVFAGVTPSGFLLKYGYLKENSNNRGEEATPEEMQKAILHFQKFNGLKQTGMMDEETEKKMIAPRCGVKDVNEEIAEYRTVSKWPKNLITWKISEFSKTSQLSHAEQRRAIQKGLERWAAESALIFRETSGEPTLDIKFGRKHHGDNYAFDGRGSVLAHAFFPTNGDTHFDDDELWVNGKQLGGTDLETVAAHEFGHALGLAHTEVPKALMAPYYQEFPDGFKLHQDDIRGIQRLYGKNTTPKKTTPKNTTPRATQLPTVPTLPPVRGNGFCNHFYRKIDAAMRISGNDFVFVDSGKVIDGRSGQKTNIQKLFPNGPNFVHAAVYSNRVRRAYLFKGKHVWSYSQDSYGRFILANNFPKTLSNSYSHKPETVMKYNSYGSERIFLIKNGYFMEFTPYYDSVSPGRGYSTRRFFPNIPQRIDATVSTDNEAFFIVNEKAFKMSFRSRNVEIRGKPVNLAFNKCQN